LRQLDVPDLDDFLQDTTPEDTTMATEEKSNEEKSNEELIALMEEVLTNLKGDSNTADKTSGPPDKESSIMELDEALKQLN
jgi:hypothetical protein